MTTQTVIKEDVSVEKAVEPTNEDPLPEFDNAWRCTLAVDSEYEFPVAIRVVDTLPPGHSAPNVAIPSNGADYEVASGEDEVTFSCFVTPGETTTVSYVLFTDLPAREAFASAPTIERVQPVDPATVDEADGAPTWRGGTTTTTGTGSTGGISPLTGGTDTADGALSEDGDGTQHGNSDATTVAIEPSAQRMAISERAAAKSGVLVPRGSSHQPTVSVVMPTMNEEAGIGECIDRALTALREIGYTAEIIVSDSSDDRTPDIAAEKGAHVVTPDKEGYGYAYRYAFERARGEYIVMGDADTTYDFEELPKLFRQLQAADADIVLGSRLNGEIKPDAMPALHQYVGNPLLTKFLNVFYDAGVSDAHSGFRVITKEALDQLELRSDGMEFASEMIMQAGEQGLTIAEVPITYHERTGEATLDSLRDGWRHVRFMLVNAPGYLFSGPAIGLLLIGVSTMLLSLYNWQALGVFFGTQTMVAGSLLTIIGYQVGGLAIASSIAADPIRETKDPVTNRIRHRFRLEHGTTAGVVVLALAGTYATVLILQWVQSGYSTLPNLARVMIAFTGVVIGVQTVFTSFFLSLLSMETRDTG